MSFEIPLIRADFPPVEDVAADYEVIMASGRFSNFGPREQRFRQGIARRLGVPGVATYSSATIGLVAALATLVGIGDGRRRIVLPSFTFAAAAQAVEMLDFVPAFVDVDERTLSADPDRIRDLIEDGPTAGLLLANPFGIGSAAAADWERVAVTAQLPLIIDSAAGFGAEYPDGSPVGGHGDAEVFSFHATKPLAVGEGGAVTTADEDLADQLRSASNFGFDGGRESVRWGLNGKLSELHAAIGIRQLDRLDGILAERRRVLGWFSEALGRHRVPDNVERSTLAFLPLILDEGADRDGVVAALAAEGVEARTYYAPALHRHPRFAGAPRGPLDVTERIEDRVVSLPVHEGVTRDVVARMARVLNESDW
ncbi:MAG: DegT/DnrJ/EryC1/StrS family aminotransferase [Leifsonia sp.]|uniref:DegT/DnrJ/EryC1/StrS family aminotransferase n=1 Tax=Leifsonia sp. TaxID=1870902 RepID=UPI003F7E62DC